jgi:hypothetical protein
MQPEINKKIEMALTLASLGSERVEATSEVRKTETERDKEEKREIRKAKRRNKMQIEEQRRIERENLLLTDETIDEDWQMTDDDWQMANDYFYQEQLKEADEFLSQN